MATLAELVDLAQGKYLSVLHASKGVSFNRAFAVAAINSALHRIERLALWTFAEGEAELTSTPLNHALTSPSDYGVGLMLHDLTTGRNLEYHDDRQAVLPQQTRGVPSHYSEWKGEIRLWPLPTTARPYLLRYYSTWADLVADGDVPPIPAAFHELLASYAARSCILRTPPEGDRFLPSSAAEPFEMEWREGLASMLDSPYTLKSLDSIPYLEHTHMVVEGQGALW